MQKQNTLRPLDLMVVLGLSLPGATAAEPYDALGKRLGLSASTAHQAVGRLQAAGLVRPGSREPNRHALRNFLAHGVRYAFPPSLGPEVLGVPTAHAGPALSELIDGGTPFVWPDVNGTVRGRSLTPLHPSATKLPKRAPEVYGALTLVDAIRAGRAREREAATAALDRLLGTSGA
jgi:hypothetical protein